MESIELINQISNLDLANWINLVNDVSSFLVLYGIICVVAVFDIVMRLISMYRAWTRRNVGRFVCLAIFSTCWILPIIYLATHKKID